MKRILIIISKKKNQFTYAFVDNNDFKLLNKYKWYFHKGGYAVTHINYKNVKMHRLILSLDKGQICDHADRNKLNNCKYNLRICGYKDNNCNKEKPRNNTSGYKGVTWNKRAKKWKAQIQKDYKRIHLGYFINKHDAAFTYNNAAIKYHGNFAYLNNVLCLNHVKSSSRMGKNGRSQPQSKSDCGHNQRT